MELGLYSFGELSPQIAPEQRLRAIEQFAGEGVPPVRAAGRVDAAS